MELGRLLWKLLLWNPRAMGRREPDQKKKINKRNKPTNTQVYLAHLKVREKGKKAELILVWKR